MQLEIVASKEVESEIRQTIAVQVFRWVVARLTGSQLLKAIKRMKDGTLIGAITSELEFKLGRSRQLEAEVAKLQSQLVEAAASQEPPSNNNAKHTPTHLKSRIKAN